ncbi:MAG TPA: oxidoreductase [Candidatus Limnocylindria bacterium]|jgi:coenzyme F420-reducing hydrogenase gamma subunit
MTATTVAAPRVGVVKMASCDGCQLTLLDLEDELLAIGERFELVDFPEATSRRSEGPYDVLLVEGSISTPEQAEQIEALRERSTLLVTIGACATAGGIQAMRNWGNEPEWRAVVYPQPEYIESLAQARPVSDYVKVDAELRGCPIDPGQLLELLTALRLGRRPQLPDEAVCLECKRLGRVCVLVAGGAPCMGPLTVTGCGALCPGFARGCYACFGPRERANVTSLAGWFAADLGRSGPEVDRLFAGFTGWSEPFRERARRAVSRFGTGDADGSVRGEPGTDEEAGA